MRGKADGLFINTTGLGVLEDGFRPDPSGGRPGDVVLVSGPLGRHGIAIMAVREGLACDVELESDTASLFPLVHALRQAAGAGVRTMRDPTRGGLASALNEIAASSGVGVELVEHTVPLPVPSRPLARCWAWAPFMWPMKACSPPSWHRRLRARPCLHCVHIRSAQRPR